MASNNVGVVNPGKRYRSRRPGLAGKSDPVCAEIRKLTRVMTELESQPPSLQASHFWQTTMRFDPTASGTVNITAQDLGALCVMATSATTGYIIPTSVRVKKVEIWAGPGSTLNPVTCAVTFQSGGGGNDQTISDTSMGSSRGAHVVAKPRKTSGNAQWVAAALTNTLFNMTFSTNSIIDVTVQFCIRPVNAAAPVVVMAGATIGDVYAKPLGFTSGSNFIIPISWQTA